MAISIPGDFLFSRVRVRVSRLSFLESHHRSTCLQWLMCIGHCRYVDQQKADHDRFTCLQRPMHNGHYRQVDLQWPFGETLTLIRLYMISNFWFLAHLCSLPKFCSNNWSKNYCSDTVQMVNLNGECWTWPFSGVKGMVPFHTWGLQEHVVRKSHQIPRGCKMAEIRPCYLKVIWH